MLSPGTVSARQTCRVAGESSFGAQMSQQDNLLVRKKCKWLLVSDFTAEFPLTIRLRAPEVERVPAGIASWKVICSHGQHELGSQQTGIFPVPLEVLESRERLSSPEAALHQADLPSPIVGLWVCVWVRARDRASRACVRVVSVEMVMVFFK